MVKRFKSAWQVAVLAYSCTNSANVSSERHEMNVKQLVYHNFWIQLLNTVWSAKAVILIKSHPIKFKRLLFALLCS